MTKEATIGEFLCGLLPRLRHSGKRDIPPWPPDVFGLMAALVQRSGLYGAVLTRWPPRADYVAGCTRLSADWRLAFSGEREVPREVRKLWSTVVGAWGLPFSEIASNAAARRAVLKLMAVADECGAGLGGLFADSENDEYLENAAALLGAERGGSTLCDEIHPSRLRVLPKRRTPPSGLNVRSLSLHLTCIFGCEVTPYWAPLMSFPPSTETVNLLIIPFPFVVDPLSFAGVKQDPREMSNMDGNRFGFFTVNRRSEEFRVGQIVKTALAQAVKRVGRVHVVLFPEAALTPEEYAHVKGITEANGVVLMAGVGAAAVNEKQPGRNSVMIADPTYSELRQEKHHRWRLDRSQILQYDLGATLNPARDWWEYIAIHDRRQHFLQVANWLLIAPLICEDLARPDPVGDVVRAVGPDLVIAFLMDGPQLAQRWPARYATVPADDPGCSVLTITSIGMSLRSKPPAGIQRSRQIASWKDPLNGLRGIEQETTGVGALVLTLNQDTRKDTGQRQVSADGRVNQFTVGFPILSRVQWLELEENAQGSEGGDDKVDRMDEGG